jgi:hypothetical protein
LERAEEHLDAYRRLLTWGRTSGGEPHPDSQDEAHWLRRQAEPFWTAMRKLAAEDGLRVVCFVGAGGHAMFIQHADVCLTRPDGSRYRWDCATSAEQARADIHKDWGDTLEAARKRRGTDPRFADWEARQAAYAELEALLRDDGDVR